jgi:hypothetical protein
LGFAEKIGMTGLPGAEVWSLVLGVRKGVRQPSLFTQQWSLRRDPQRHYSFAGSRSAFQQTLDVADSLSIPQCKVVVVGSECVHTALSQLGDRNVGILLTDRASAEIGSSLRLGLSPIQSANPGAIVVVLPCDFFFHPEERLIRAVHAATAAAESGEHNMVLLSAPCEPGAEDGFVEVGPEQRWILGYRFSSIDRFVDHPRAEARERLWKPLLLVARVETLWNIALGDQVHTTASLPRRAYADRGCRSRGSASVFQRVVECSPAKTAALEMTDVFCCDSRRLKRIAAMAAIENQ